MQVSPSGMAAASQAVPGEFDSRHLLQKVKRTQQGAFFFLEDKVITDESRGASCPLNKALVMPCRDEVSKRIGFAFAVTERKENRTLREKARFTNTARILAKPKKMQAFSVTV